mmetsp:Transcript_43648/g.81122  ORF Transcript_43648/g.81122 Transcript_43648/m.81122 type:complete len:159 (-) Transcript_43648:162-638(-)
MQSLKAYFSQWLECCVNREKPNTKEVGLDAEDEEDPMDAKMDKLAEAYPELLESPEVKADKSNDAEEVKPESTSSTSNVDEFFSPQEKTPEEPQVSPPTPKRDGPRRTKSGRLMAFAMCAPTLCSPSVRSKKSVSWQADTVQQKEQHNKSDQEAIVGA